nr:uncharacterized protein LOC123759266 [Procambarus clarkii]
MIAVLYLELLLVATSLLSAVDLLTFNNTVDRRITLLSGCVEAVLTTVSEPRCSVMFFTDGASTLRTVAKNSILRLQHRNLWTFSCVSVFEVSTDGEDVRRMQLSMVVGEAQRLRQVSWCVTVVVVSDDLTFLATFAQWSLRSRLVVPTTRLLALTDASLVNTPGLSKIFSMMNALMIVQENSLRFLRCGVYLQVPYSPLGAQALKVASWTPQGGLALTSSLPLFPDKFSRLSNRPTLVVISEPYLTHEAVMVDDPKSPGGKRLTFSSSLANVLQVFAEATNFTYTWVRSPDQLWGNQLRNGSWSGLIGVVSREQLASGACHLL